MLRYLLSNAFPTALMRRKIMVSPISLEMMRRLLTDHYFVSVWGHDNTLSLASLVLGIDVTPLNRRDVVMLDAENYPTVRGERFTRVLILSPDLPQGFRPESSEVIIAEQISRWFPLLLDFAAADE